MLTVNWNCYHYY